MEINKFIENRWSPRAFADKAISDTLLQEIFKAASRAPSASNDQPWRFIVGKAGSKTYDLIYSTLVEFNQAWTKTAPVLAIGLVNEISDKTGEKNTHAEYDTGASLSYLTMKAFENNVFVHQMGGFNKDKCDEIFKVPENHHSIVAFALGYIGDKNQIHEKIAALENGVSLRKDINSYVFEDEFNNSKDWQLS